MVPQDKKIQEIFQLQQDVKFPSKSSSCSNNKIYVGNSNDLIVVVSLWIFYFIASAYFLIVITPYFWINYSPAITIIGIFLSIPGLYNAIKCYFTDPGVLKKGTHIKEDQQDEEKQIGENKIGNFSNKRGKNNIIGDEKLENQNQIQKGENNIETQKIVINEKHSNIQQMINLKGENQQEQNKIEEQQHNKTEQPLPKLDVELTQIQQQEGNNSLNEWVAQMQKGLNQIQNGLNNCDQQLKVENYGINNQQNQEGFPPTVNTNDISQQPVFINPFPIKLPPHMRNNKHKGGNLFEERYCETCQLKRPPLASHCYFMGNCIGQRNHKNFYLFLWCTLIWVIYQLIFCIISFAQNIKNNGFVFAQFYKNTPLFYVFIISVGLFIITFVVKCNEQTVRIASVPAIIITLISFIWIASYQDVDYYANPVIPLLGMGINGFAIIALLNFAIFDCFLACIGSTIKQESYKQKQQMERKKFTLSQGCATYFKFLTFNAPKSEILDE